MSTTSSASSPVTLGFLSLFLLTEFMVHAQAAGAAAEADEAAAAGDKLARPDA